MAIVAVFHAPQITREQYEEVRQLVDWEGQPAEGGLLHVSAFDADGGMHVADVWESEEQMRAFFEQRLLPACQQAGIEPPVPELLLPVHNLNAYPALEQYQIPGGVR